MIFMKWDDIVGQYILEKSWTWQQRYFWRPRVLCKYCCCLCGAFVRVVIHHLSHPDTYPPWYPPCILIRSHPWTESSWAFTSWPSTVITLYVFAAYSLHELLCSTMFVDLLVIRTSTWRGTGPLLWDVWCTEQQVN